MSEGGTTKRTTTQYQVSADESSIFSAYLLLLLHSGAVGIDFVGRLLTPPDQWFSTEGSGP